MSWIWRWLGVLSVFGFSLWLSYHWFFCDICRDGFDPRA